jgi:cytochrome c oxidase cbb3-type subunit III
MVTEQASDVQRRTRGTRRARWVSACSAISALIVVASYGVSAQRRDYPTRPPGDPAAVERGKALYGVNCQFCHGADTRGGDGGGPNLLRSALVLDDQKGELIGPIVRDGRGSMPRFQLSPEQTADIAEFLHSFTVESRSGPSKINILVGDAKQGEAFVAQKCASCHTTAVLSTFAARPQLRDPIVLQQMWLMPGSGGGRGGGNSPVPAPPIAVTVTLPSGEKVEGTLERMDDFVVTLTQADGRRRTVRTAGTTAKVDVRDPLQPHKDLLKVYSDSDIHNVTAYLASLGKP